jgi:hypothetical protein
MSRKKMPRDVILGLVAATLVGILLAPVDALAHGGHLDAFKTYGLKVCSAADHRGWNPFSRDPGQAGYPGPHYGCDCYRAANGRAICPFY